MDSSQKAARTRFTNTLLFLLKAAGFLVLGIALLALLLLWSCSSPSDKSLAQRFNRHRSEFETLVRMLQEDADVIRIADDFTRLKDNWGWPRPESQWGVSRNRWNEYRKLFRRVGLRAGLQKDAVGNVYFMAFTEGLALHGASKGFVYCGSVGNPDDVFLPCSEHHESGLVERTPGRGSSYRRLKENWYIFEDWN